MNYAKNAEKNIPIGSGITEAACKVIVKQRLCCSGMKWKDEGASAVLTLRCLNYSDGRWEQFRNKIDRYGFSLTVWFKLQLKTAIMLNSGKIEQILVFTTDFIEFIFANIITSPHPIRIFPSPGGRGVFYYYLKHDSALSILNL